MTDHLQEAKENLDNAYHDHNQIKIAQAHSLIAIAEQLKKMNTPESLCYSCSHLDMYCPIFKESKDHEFKTTDCTSHLEEK